MNILRIFCLTALILLANCTPVLTPREHTLGKPNGVPGDLYTSALRTSIRDRGIENTIAFGTVPRGALVALESDLRAYAQKSGADFRQASNFSTLTFNSRRLIGGDPEGLIPYAWEELAELGQILNREPSLLVIIHGHAPFVFNERVTLQAGFVDATRVSQALETAGKMSTERIACFGCGDCPPGTLSVTLVPMEIARHY